jgi:hypothetical protein
MVHREVIPRQLPTATYTHLSFFAIPEKTPLLGRERASVVLVLKEGTEQASKDLGATLPVRGAVCIALHGQQVASIELL